MISQEELLKKKVIEYRDMFKYLGVTFDNRPTCREPFIGLMKKAKALLKIGK